MDGELVRFVDELPPGAPNPNVHWNAVVAELRAQPGRWAEILHVARGGAPHSGVTIGPFAAPIDSLRSRGCETAVRASESHYTLYARCWDGV